ncbi:Mep1a [Symbiodinium natans]|uniref:Mep1a protein n=1 Tax=Symbiodinium natans TaxID=878477 RepID=A0A812ID31_9DINO|nr:Mep1a [Symbiodinium natans]
MHEIGHCLGMHHTQKRADGSQEYFGHGPHLKMYWENVASTWVGQYTPDNRPYTGSGYEGEGDVHVGYAPYDFESIMHYPRQGGAAAPYYDTVPSSYNSVVGQRWHLSAGDILQIQDMYNCKRHRFQVQELPTSEAPEWLLAEVRQITITTSAWTTVTFQKPFGEVTVRIALQNDRCNSN